MSEKALVLVLLVFLAAGIKNGSCTEKGVCEIIGGKVENFLQNHPVYEFNNTDLRIITGGTRLEGVLNATLDGISDVEIKQNCSGLKVTLQLNFKKLAIKGNYNLDGVIAGLLLIGAEGPAVIEANNLEVIANLNLHIIGTSVDITDIDIKLGSFYINLAGFLGDLSDDFNIMLNDIAPQLFNAYEGYVEAYVTRTLNNLISKGTKITELQDISNEDIDLILNNLLTDVLKMYSQM